MEKRDRELSGGLLIRALISFVRLSFKILEAY
jgi:hypothetical protein